jgi:hypothetical protein
MNIIVTSILATFIGMGAWHNIGNSQTAASKVNVIMFFCVVNQGILAAMGGVYAFPMERALMLKERASGAYYVSAYFFSKTTMDMIIQSMNPVLFSM